MSNNAQHVIGVDLGGTKIATALMTVDGKIVRSKRVDTLVHEGPEAVIARIIQSVRDVQQGCDIIGVGVGSPGPLDGKEGVILHSPNLPGWDNLPLKTILARRLNCDVILVNDANVAAWGEYVFGAGQGTENMVYVTMSTGIGTGLVLNGQLYDGSQTFGGEFGHSTIVVGGEICSCGNPGCWEAYASGTAIGRYAREAAKSEKTLIADLAQKEGVTPAAKHVFEAAALGDPVAKNIFDQVVLYAAVGLRNIVHTINPERIVIGGGVSKAGKPLFDALTKKTNELVMEAYVGAFDIVQAKLGDDVGTIGAAALFLRKS